MNKRLKNNGFSMIELIVIIAIMAVGVTAFSVSIATVVSNNARQVSTNIDALISKGITNSNYRSPWVYIEISISADGNSYIGRCFENSSTLQTDMLGPAENLGSTRVQIILNGFANPSITTANPLRIAFERGTGRMYEVTNVSTFTCAELTGRPEIEVGASRNYVVELVARTGGHSITRG